MTSAAVSALLVGIATAGVTALGAVLASTRERSRIRLMERLAKLEKRLDEGSAARRDVRRLQDVLGEKLLAHYEYAPSLTCRNAAIGCVLVAVSAGVGWVWILAAGAQHTAAPVVVAEVVAAVGIALAVLFTALWWAQARQERRRQALKALAQS